MRAPRRVIGHTVRLWAAVLLVMCVWAVPGCSEAEDMSWDRLAKGLEVAVWEPGPTCLGQLSALVMVKVDPAQFRFDTYHFRDEGLGVPPTIHEWQQRTHASIVFNAGLFKEDYSYLGLLLKGGRSLGSRLHPEWKGLFVAEPSAPDHQRARVVDLEQERFAVEMPVYREAAQSLMLVDAQGRPRVRQTGKRAHQTIVGEDRDGNILLLKTAEAVPMWELAVCLRDNMPTLRHAMAMDGGSSSDMLLAGEFLPQSEDNQSPPRWRALLEASSPVHIPLPTVIGVKPRTDDGS